MYYCEFHHAVWWKSLYGYSKLCNINTHKKKLIHCVAIFTILYGNYYPPQREFKLICVGKFTRGAWVDFTQHYGKNRQRCEQNNFTMLYGNYCCIIIKNFLEIFTTLSMVICFSMGTLGIFATLFYVFTMRVVIYDILSMAIIPTLSTSILFCNLCYILLWILPRSVVKIAIRI